MNDGMERFVSGFEGIKVYSLDGTELWRARDLMSVFGYYKWERFNDCIHRSMTNFDSILINLYVNGIRSANFALRAKELEYRLDPNSHFIPTVYIVRCGKKNETIRQYPDYYLTRLACYAIAMEADNRKPVIKLARQHLVCVLSDTFS